MLQTDDLPSVRASLNSLLATRRRTIVHPLPRKPERFDPMQYGASDEVARWGFAAFPGAPGWTVLRTAPLELAIDPPGSRTLLAELAVELSVKAFQYNVYDGSSHFLYEVDERGRVERSGFVGSDPARHWGEPPPADRCSVRFCVVDPGPAVECSLAAAPSARVSGMVPTYVRPSSRSAKPEIEALWDDMERTARARRERLLEWLERTGGVVTVGGLWSHHPAQVVLALADGDTDFLPIEGVVDRAMTTVFGGPNREHCDNGFIVETLIPHRRTSMPGFLLFAEKVVDG